LGGQGDFDRVSKGIVIAQQIAHNRHANEDKGHKEHKILPIFFDDWTNIIKAVDNAKNLIFEATTLYASVNIILYFIIHSDTANAWGTDRTGAALKNNFVKLFILPTYNEQGLVIHSQTRGAIRFPGESMDRPVKLLNGPIASRAIGQRVNDFEPVLSKIEGLDRLDLTPKPDATEARILELYRQGESFNEISRQVYGHTGGKQTNQIKEVIERFN
jgi:hypothetical protein